MSYEEILYDVADNIATVTFNRPDKLNAWTLTMEGEYRHAMADAEQRDDVRAIVLTGAGRGFCAGADMSLLSSVAGGDTDIDSDQGLTADPGQDDDVREDFKKTYSFPMAIRKPIIAAVNGHAVGIGMVLPLYCDFRFASDEAKFATVFARRGLVAEYGVAWILPRLIGLENALDLLFTGRTVAADEALRLGLVSRVFPQDVFMDKVYEFAKELTTRSSPRSLGVMKRQIYDAQLTDLGPAIDTAMNEMLLSFNAEDFREGIASFLEKREPNFTGK